MKKKLPRVAARAARFEPEPACCHTCRQAIAVYDGVSYGSMEKGYRELCGRCFNEEVANAGDFDFQHVQFEPVEMRDAAGETHEFHFRVRLLGDRVSLNAVELRDGEPHGYEFQILDDAEKDLFELMGQLVGRMRRALALRHLRHEKRFGWTIDDMLVRARITWDEEKDGRAPLLVIDGRDVTWEQFGRMLMSYEGWQFKLEIRDRSEEI